MTERMPQWADMFDYDFELCEPTEDELAIAADAQSLSNADRIDYADELEA